LVAERPSFGRRKTEFIHNLGIGPQDVVCPRNPEC
jgi:hypothetical protein